MVSPRLNLLLPPADEYALISALAARTVSFAEAGGALVPIVTAPSEVIRSLSVPVVANVSVPLLDFCASRITPASLSVFWNVDIFRPELSIPKVACCPLVVPVL